MLREVLLETNNGVYQYLEEDILGEGGFGSVFLGENKKNNKKVAIKRPHFYSQKALEKFKEKECRYLPRLRHPGIVQVLDILTEVRNLKGEIGPPALIMEYVEGKNLQASFAEISLLLFSQKLQLFQQICEAVAYAHQKGILHRDLKPSNIILTSSTQPKIIDFGLATSLNLKSSLPSSSQKFIGSLLYMSPEQYEAKAANEKSDTYTLGLILFYIFTGKHAKELLLRGDTTLEKIFQKHLPVEIATICIHTCCQNLTGRASLSDLQQFIFQLLEKETSEAASLKYKVKKQYFLLKNKLINSLAYIFLGTLQGLAAIKAANSFSPIVQIALVLVTVFLFLVLLWRETDKGYAFSLGILISFVLIPFSQKDGKIIGEIIAVFTIMLWLKTLHNTEN